MDFYSYGPRQAVVSPSTDRAGYPPQKRPHLSARIVFYPDIAFEDQWLVAESFEFPELANATQADAKLRPHLSL